MDVRMSGSKNLSTDLRIYGSNGSNGSTDLSKNLRLQKCLGIRPLSQLALEVAALVDENLAVLGEHDAGALERARRRAFEVDAGRAEAAAVARALEFVFGREVVRRTAKVRARDTQRVEAARVLVDILGSAHQPDAELLFPPLVDAHPVLVREPGLELLRRLVQDVGEHEPAGRGKG